MEQDNKRKIDEVASGPTSSSTGEEGTNTTKDAAEQQPSAKRAKIAEVVGEITPARIQKQIEFYFSDSNYRRDHWLQEEAAKHPEGFVEIAKVAAFPRLQAMTTDINQITELMRSSDRLKVSDDGLLVKRALPLPAEDDSPQRSILVKGLPDTITIESVDSHFSQYGPVARVVIFRNKETNKPQGSVVVEFDKKEGAHAALAAATQKYEDHEITVTAKSNEKQKDAKEQRKRKASDEQNEDDEKQGEKKRAEKLAAMQGTVVHLTLTPASAKTEEMEKPNKWDFKSVFEEVGSVKFVDLKNDDLYVRMGTPELAKESLALFAEPKEVKGIKLENARILAGDDEKSYLEQAQLKARHGNRGRRGRGRGRGRRGRN